VGVLKKAMSIVLLVSLAVGLGGCTILMVKAILTAREKHKAQESRQPVNAAGNQDTSNRQPPSEHGSGDK
jgi:hypothetical protein